jgi:ubiquitin carboxyl-terminal hydrolase 36/42
VIDKAPDVLAFQLKRFTTLGNSVQMIYKHVAYPSELDLKLFHSSTEKEVSFCALLCLYQKLKILYDLF